MAGRTSKPTRHNPGPQGKLHNLFGAFLGNTASGIAKSAGSKEPGYQYTENRSLGPNEYGPPAATEGPQLSMTGEAPGFWKNFLTGGRAGDNYQALSNNLEAMKFEKALKEQELARKIAGDLATANMQNIGTMEKEKFQASSAQDLAKLNAALTNKFADFDQYSQSLPPLTIAKNAGDLAKQQVLNNAYETPPFQQSLLDKELAENRKQGSINSQVEADTAATKAKTPGLAWSQLGNNALFNPGTRETIINDPALQLDPEKTLAKGGISSGMVPVMGGFAVKKNPLAAITQGPEITSPVPQPTPQDLPKFDFPQPPTTVPKGYEPYADVFQQPTIPPPVESQPFTPIQPYTQGPQPPKMDTGKMLDILLQRLRKGASPQNPYNYGY